jgi:hypothetical protein
MNNYNNILLLTCKSIIETYDSTLLNEKIGIKYEIINNKITKLINLKRIDKNKPLLLIYADLYNNLQKYKTISNYLQTNNIFKELVELLVENVYSNKEYDYNFHSMIARKFIGYKLVDTMVHNILEQRYDINTDTNIRDLIDLNNKLIVPIDKIVVQAGLIAKLYI